MDTGNLDLFDTGTLAAFGRSLASDRATIEADREDSIIEAAPLRGQLRTPATLRPYVLGGHGRLTIVSRRSGQRFTFALGRSDDKDDARIFVKVLTGPNNGADYSYLGTLWTKPSEWNRRTYPPRYVHGKKSAISAQAPSNRCAEWLFDRVVRGNDEELAALLEQADVFHEGRCGRCGRPLTVPASIETGLGPVCAAKEE